MKDFIHEKDKKWLQYNPNTKALYGDLDILLDNINEIIKHVNELTCEVRDIQKKLGRESS